MTKQKNTTTKILKIIKKNLAPAPGVADSHECLLEEELKKERVHLLQSAFVWFSNLVSANWNWSANINCSFLIVKRRPIKKIEEKYRETRERVNELRKKHDDVKQKTADMHHESREFANYIETRREKRWVSKIIQAPHPKIRHQQVVSINDDQAQQLKDLDLEEARLQAEHEAEINRINGLIRDEDFKRIKLQDELQQMADLVLLKEQNDRKIQASRLLYSLPYFVSGIIRTIREDANSWRGNAPRNENWVSQETKGAPSIRRFDLKRRTPKAEHGGEKDGRGENHRRQKRKPRAQKTSDWADRRGQVDCQGAKRARGATEKNSRRGRLLEINQEEKSSFWTSKDFFIW